MAAKKRTGKRVSGDPRKNAKDLSYKGSRMNENQIAKAIFNEVFPRMYNTDLMWCKKLGVEHKLMPYGEYLERLNETVDSLRNHMALMLGALATQTCGEIADLLFKDGFIVEYTTVFNSKEDAQKTMEYVDELFRLPIAVLAKIFLKMQACGMTRNIA